MCKMPLLRLLQVGDDLMACCCNVLAMLLLMMHSDQ
jgi:hypothetical protein